ncbi:DUF1259 domain-containing protein [Fredinandcohnia humi]
MKKRILLLTLLIMSLSPTTEAEIKPTCKALEDIFKTKVSAENGRCGVEIIRKDLDLTHMGKKMSPETMEVVFHFTFEQVDSQTAVMGELALVEDEVNPVIRELQKGNLDVSALHNHMIHEQPRIMYIHFQGIGDMIQQANTIKKAIDKTK